jgi:hypothetical protein
MTTNPAEDISGGFEGDVRRSLIWALTQAAEFIDEKDARTEDQIRACLYAALALTLKTGQPPDALKTVLCSGVVGIDDARHFLQVHIPSVIDYYELPAWTSDGVRGYEYAGTLCADLLEQCEQIENERQAAVDRALRDELPEGLTAIQKAKLTRALTEAVSALSDEDRRARNATGQNVVLHIEGELLRFTWAGKDLAYMERAWLLDDGDTTFPTDRFPELPRE